MAWLTRPLPSGAPPMAPGDVGAVAEPEPDEARPRRACPIPRVDPEGAAVVAEEARRGGLA